GAALQRHQEFTAARDIWERLRQARPEDATALVGLADAYDGLGDQAAVVRTLQELVARFPQHPAYRRRLVDLYLRLGKSTEAETVWTDLITMLPPSTTGYVGLARLYESRKDYTVALQGGESEMHTFSRQALLMLVCLGLLSGAWSVAGF